MFCTKCGTENETGRDFCRQCGTPLSKAQGNTHKKQSYLTGVIIALVIIIVLIVIAVCGFVIYQKNVDSKNKEPQEKTEEKASESDESEATVEEAEEEIFGYKIVQETEDIKPELVSVNPKGSECEYGYSCLIDGEEITGVIVDYDYSYIATDIPLENLAKCLACDVDDDGKKEIIILVYAIGNTLCDEAGNLHVVKITDGKPVEILNQYDGTNKNDDGFMTIGVEVIDGKLVVSTGTKLEVDGSPEVVGSTYEMKYVNSSWESVLIESSYNDAIEALNTSDGVIIENQHDDIPPVVIMEAKNKFYYQFPDDTLKKVTIGSLIKFVDADSFDEMKRDTDTFKDAEAIYIIWESEEHTAGGIFDFETGEIFEYYEYENNNISEEEDIPHTPFYGIWIGADKDESRAWKIAQDAQDKGLYAAVYLTTEWNNLNKDPYYVITAGVYDSKNDATAALENVKAYYPKAYVKYSGEWIGY